VSKSDRISVSREALETMLAAVATTRNAMPTVFNGEAFEQGQTLQRLMTKLLDVEIALEALCPPQS
jgi:hypothetical protein